MFYSLLKPFLNSSTKRSLKRGEIIYHEGDLPTSLFFVESGLVGLFHISQSGKETFLRVFGKDSIFGHRSYFADSPYHANSVALENTDLVIIPKDQCQKICESRPDLLKEMTKMIARDLGDAELRLSGRKDKSAPRRIAEALVFLKLKHPDHVWTRKEIAEFSGSTFESVARVMTKLDELGFISKDGRDFIINNPQSILEFDGHQS
jgi:CRP-like cAMP-binding protein